MDNCGGGQRLPPDGDEFPAAYQEFGNSNNNQQYRFVAAATRTTTMTTSAGLVCNESESFVGTDGFKMLTSDSNVVGSRSIVLSGDTRVTVASVENSGDESKTSFLPDDVVKKTGSSYSRFTPQNSNVLLSEKKIEIAGYYHKDVGLSETADVHEKEATTVDVPPPLPLTGPPKIEPVTLHNRNLDTPPQRKFSLNGELWRQDDKSERSVRDKIAMFSSQSSLDSPLFPNSLTVAAVTSNGRRLSKYKSSEDVCADDKSPVQKERSSFLDRTQSSFDLTDSSRSFASESPRKYGRSTSLSQSTSSSLNSTLPATHVTKIESQKNSVISTTPLISSFEKQNFAKTLKINYNNCYTANSANPQSSLSNVGKTYNSNCTNNSSNCSKPTTTTALTRATSFSGSSAFTQDRSTPSTIELNSTQISRTNSLASTFRRPSEDMRRTSLNQLIEQRRRSISKLRGLVIPEKETLPIDQPIVDLPEIKSRDSILLHQIPKANIQDKWGSQSSLASTTSTASVPAKATTSFKMPAPQIHSKYSPAFKRKSLTVYGSSTSSINGNMNNEKHTLGAPNTNLTSEPPKSLESICSPTRSDYSFEFASSSPDGSRSRPKTVQRKSRTDYDDSDNDSAVSSSQSSISRGFSPPMSPVPSERSTVSSSERSYVSTETNYQRRSLIMESPGRTFVRAETVGAEREQFSRGILGEKTSYLATERSPNGGGSNSRSSSEIANTQNPPRQLRRSNSTDTNCSSSSTLTSGSQASAESLSRRVLKPQSVEAINRKNILASARCRSGRDLNGSPLIQRKFSDDEESAVSSTTSTTTTTTTTVENGGQRTGSNNVTSMQDVKIAYIEVTDSFIEDNSGFKKNDNEPKLPPKRSIPAPAVRPPKSEMLEPSNDLKMWVRTEAKALARSEENNKTVNSKIEKNTQLSEEVETHQTSLKIHSNNTRNGRPSIFEEQSNIPTSIQKKISPESENESSSIDSSKQRKSNFKRAEDQNDLLTILTTRSRSRSAIHVDDGSFGRSKSQMSLEDILSGKGTDPKLLRTQSVEAKSEKNGAHSDSPSKTGWMESRIENRYRKSSGPLSESWSNEEKPFVSKIPTLGRSKIIDSGEETSDADRSRTSSSSIPSKIPSGRSLSRRSASVTDMKKALEKMDNLPNQHQTTTSSHSRFPSLDSSIDENSSTVGTTEGEVERCYGEQFGSISSLASSTSLISQQELAQLVEEASLEEAGRGAHEVIVVLLHKENPTGSVGITLAGGADCEVKEITVHRVLTHSIADKDGRVQRGDRILSINGRSTRGLTHRESLAVLKQPRSEVVLVVSRTRLEEGCKLRSRTASVETIVEGFETNGCVEDTAWGPPSTVAVYKDGAGLGFSLEGGRDSPLGDRPLVIKKIFTGGAAEKTGVLKAGDQLLEVNGSDVTRMSRIEAWSLMKKLHDGEVNLLVRHPATKSSS